MDLSVIGYVETQAPRTSSRIRLVVRGSFSAAIIGFERESSERSAGLRTHILIALAAALYVHVSLEIFYLPDVAAQGRSDPVRAVEAVTAGIAFLGAGAIFRGGNGRGG